MDKSGTIILAASLFIIMLGMGLSLTINDFKRIFNYPKAIIVGLVNQMVLLPLIGFGLVYLLDVRPEIAVGIIILAACPGGATSNLITHLAKGDTALSVSLTALSSTLTIFTIPFIVQLGLNTFMASDQVVQLDVSKIIAQLFIINIIPIVIGMIINTKAPAFAKKMDKPVRIASALVLALVILGLVLKEKVNIESYFQDAGLIALSLNMLTMAVGFVSSKAMRLTAPQSVSISIESGIQNGTLAIGIAVVTLGNSAFAISGAIYSLIMFVTASIVIGFRLKK